MFGGGVEDGAEPGGGWLLDAVDRDGPISVQVLGHRIVHPHLGCDDHIPRWVQMDLRWGSSLTFYQLPVCFLRLLAEQGECSNG